MFNVLLDPLPRDWNGYKIDTDFQTGIMINQCLTDDELSETEQIITAFSLLFPEEVPAWEEANACLKWYLTGYMHDNHTGKKANAVPIFDFDVDQWRIYAAFLNQYGIDLNKAELHWFTFMGLLSNLNECSLLHVMEIREKKLTPDMSLKEKAMWTERKRTFELRKNKKTQSPADKKAVEEFMKYANINKKDN